MTHTHAMDPQTSRSYLTKMRKQTWVWIVLLGIGLVFLVAPLQLVSASPVDRLIHLEADRFSYQPSVLRVNPGDRVTIQLTATDVVHGLAVDGYDVKMTSDPGQTTELSFVADKPGVFRFRCTVTCGSMHPFMIGKLQVGA
ncbi:MAG: hypothetical protein EHM41_25065, partial [Chloroflexi bacterium]